ncbi:MAG TPA: prenyltransferase [Steroidobacteraceae bacterium]|jgi:1,4-dihydroxy-2-naphthoate octaprenyltransferase|nr:prenyltransferase [Steroidobacteraceae bacterium]
MIVPHTHPPVDRPSPALAGPGLAAAGLRAFLATRPPFLIASALPVLVGTAWASSAFHRFDGLLFGLALAATLLAHAGTNVYNDVGDDVIGADPGNTDRIYPYTGGSRFIQTGLMSRREMTHLAIALCGTALLIGVLLAALRGPGIILLGATGLALGILYSLPGAQLSARGFGEAAVAAGLGILPVLGAEWLQTGFVDSGAILLCVPVSCWVAAILIVNEVPDAEADRRAQKHTLVVRSGARGARVIYRSLTLLALVASGAAIARHVLPVWYAIPAVGLAALGVIAAGRISMGRAARPRLKQAIELTLAVQAVGCSLMIVALLIERYT